MLRSARNDILTCGFEVLFKHVWLARKHLVRNPMPSRRTGSSRAIARMDGRARSALVRPQFPVILIFHAVMEASGIPLPCSGRLCTKQVRILAGSAPILAGRFGPIDGDVAQACRPQRRRGESVSRLWAVAAYGFSLLETKIIAQTTSPRPHVAGQRACSVHRVI